MIRTPLYIIVLFPMVMIAQIPVTDAATNASVSMVNSQLNNINLQLKTVNKNLSQLINLMKKNNSNNGKVKEILKEELEAKKMAPEYVTRSMDVSVSIDLKSKILEAYHISKRTVQELEYLEQKETIEFLGYAANAILETKNLFKQCNHILNTKSIILPEERLKKIDGINGKLESILDSLIAYNQKLSQINAFRKARRTLIDISKD